jgi:hypothetical protein
MGECFIFFIEFRILDYVASNGRMIMDNGLERMWQEVVIAIGEDLYQICL